MSLELAASANIPSIRSSCDRCRAHKLKCHIISGQGTKTLCERCFRAKTPCVFGRRRKSSQPSHQASYPPTAPRMPSSAASRSIAPGESNSRSVPPLLAPADAVALSTNATNQRHSGMTSLEPSAGVEARYWETFTQGVPDLLQGDRPAEHVSIGNWDWSQNVPASDHLGMLHVESSSDQTALPMSPPERAGSAKSCLDVEQRLLTLVSDIRQRLKSLDEQIAQDDAFDDGSLTEVLHLSREFGTHAGTLLAEAYVPSILTATSHHTEMNLQPSPSVMTQGNLSDEGDNAENVAMQTPSMLLVLSGYIWIVRIYGVLLRHLQTRLRKCTMSGGEPLDLGKTYNAVCLLLTALHDLEERLGKGGSLARGLVVTMLMHETMLRATQSRDDYGELAETVRSLKEVLREKMGL